METTVIPIEPRPGIHPDTRKPLTVVGVETTGIVPRLVVLITGPEGIRAELVDFARNVPQ